MILWIEADNGLKSRFEVDEKLLTEAISPTDFVLGQIRPIISEIIERRHEENPY